MVSARIEEPTTRRSRRRTRPLAILATVTALALALVACGGDATEKGGGQDGGGNGGTDNGAPCPGTEGCTPPAPSGDVKVGILTPGDVNDGGYYESFVTAARELTDENDWELIVVDRTDAADAAEQARNLCRQGVSFIAIDGASEIPDSLPVASEPVCQDAVVFALGEVELTPWIFNLRGNPYETQTAAGYATGLVMRELGIDRAGFLSGPDLEFVRTAFDAWTAGINEVLPDATTLKTLTGDMNDSALGQEAANVQISNGVGILYPYMGGATNAVASGAIQKGVRSVSPGTDRCGDPAFAVSPLFSGGGFLLEAMRRWQAGTVRMGESNVAHIGEGEFPTVVICSDVPNATKLQAELDEFMAGIGSGKIDPEQFVKSGS